MNGLWEKGNHQMENKRKAIIVGTILTVTIHNFNAFALSGKAMGVATNQAGAAAIAWTRRYPIAPNSPPSHLPVWPI
jgi:hypothetical protein